MRIEGGRRGELYCTALCTPSPPSDVWTWRWTLFRLWLAFFIIFFFCCCCCWLAAFVADRSFCLRCLWLCVCVFAGNILFTLSSFLWWNQLIALCSALLILSRWINVITKRPKAAAAVCKRCFNATVCREVRWDIDYTERHSNFIKKEFSTLFTEKERREVGGVGGDEEECASASTLSHAFAAFFSAC